MGGAAGNGLGGGSNAKSDPEGSGQGKKGNASKIGQARPTSLKTSHSFLGNNSNANMYEKNYQNLRGNGASANVFNRSKRPGQFEEMSPLGDQ